MELYRIKHIPTGLYVTPNKRGDGNLSKKGEVYKTPHRWTTLQKYPDVRVRYGLAKDIILGKYGKFEYKYSLGVIHIDDPTQFEKEVLTIIES